MPKERDILKMIWTNFFNSLKPRTLRGTVVGRDNLGNEYFEIKKTAGQRGERYFQADVRNKKLEGFDTDIPPEWEAWLRGRRPTPPTQDEIARNTAERAQTLQNAAEKGYVTSSPVVQEEKPGSFPKYDEYEQDPGHKPKSNL